MIVKAGIHDTLMILSTKHTANGISTLVKKLVIMKLTEGVAVTLVGFFKGEKKFRLPGSKTGSASNNNSGYSQSDDAKRIGIRVGVSADSGFFGIIGCHDIMLIPKAVSPDHDSLFRIWSIKNSRPACKATSRY